MKLPEIVFLLRIQLAVCDALPFHMNFYLHCHGSMKNVNRIFTEIALSITFGNADEDWENRKSIHW